MITLCARARVFYSWMLFDLFDLHKACNRDVLLSKVDTSERQLDDDRRLL